MGDSIIKNMPEIDGVVVKSFPGDTIGKLTADFLSQGFDARYGELRNKLHPESCSPLQLNKKIICKLGLFRV